MHRVLRPLGLILLWGACATPGRPASSPKAPISPAAGRIKAVAADHPLYARVEGAKLKNACAGDSDCHVGGCSREVCSAEAGVVTSCEVQSWPQGDATCGCVVVRVVVDGEASGFEQRAVIFPTRIADPDLRVR